MSDTEATEIETEEVEDDGSPRARMELHENFVAWYFETYGIDLNELDAANIIAHFSSRRAAWRKSDTYAAEFGKEARAEAKAARLAAREEAKAEREAAKAAAAEEKAAAKAAADAAKAEATSEEKPKSAKPAAGAAKKAAPAKGRTAKKSAPKAADEVFD